VCQPDSERPMTSPVSSAVSAARSPASERMSRATSHLLAEGSLPRRHDHEGKLSPGQQCGGLAVAEGGRLHRGAVPLLSPGQQCPERRQILRDHGAGVDRNSRGFSTSICSICCWLTPRSRSAGSILEEI